MRLGAAIAFLLVLPVQLRAQQAPAKPDAKAVAEQKAQFAAAVEKASAPTEQHKLLQVFVGEFDQRSEVVMGGPLPMTFHSTATGRWILGGRFVQIDSKSAADEPVKGERLMLLGYDPTAKKFTLTTFETGNLAPIVATGDWDAARKAFVLTGELHQPQGHMPFRMVLQPGADGAIAQTIEIQPPGSDAWVRCASVQYARPAPAKK